MPCNGGGPSYDEYRSYNEEKLKALLCSACAALVNFGFNFALNPALDEWWDEHKKIDETRIAKELKEKLEREHAVSLAKTKTINQLNKDEKTLLKRFNLL